MNTMQIQLSPEELRRICGDLSSELNNDMGRATGVDDEDFLAVLNAWRKNSPHYVFVKTQKGGETLAEAEDGRAMHDETADLLERLLQYLPREEVSCER